MSAAALAGILALAVLMTIAVVHEIRRSRRLTRAAKWRADQQAMNDAIRLANSGQTRELGGDM